MKTILMADPVRFQRMTTEETRATFLLNQLYEPGKIKFNYVPEIDRAAVGMVAPLASPMRCRLIRNCGRSTLPSAVSWAR